MLPEIGQARAALLAFLSLDKLGLQTAPGPFSLLKCQTFAALVMFWHHCCIVYEVHKLPELFRGDLSIVRVGLQDFEYPF